MSSVRVFVIADDASGEAAQVQLAALSTYLDASQFSLRAAVLCQNGRGLRMEDRGSKEIPRILNPASRIPAPAPSPQSPAPVLVPRSDRWAIDPRAVWQLRRLIRDASPDIVLTIGEVAAVDGRLAAVLSGAKRIITCWPSVDFDFLGGGIAKLGRWLARNTERFLFATAAERDEALVHGVPAAKCAVIPLAVMPIEKTNSRAAAFAPLAIPADARVIGVVAPWSPRHRVKEAIWSFDLIRAVRSDVHMIIAGDGQHRTELEDFRNSQECQGVVHFARPDQFPPDWLAHCDAIWSLDPGPRVAYATWQAAASGVPVIAVDTPAHRAYITSGETGMLIPIAVRPAAPQATLPLLDDEAARQKIGEASRRYFMQRHDASVMVQEIASILGGRAR
jgi:glycosyltransferase involved in cell wall biosynthesis